MAAKGRRKIRGGVARAQIEMLAPTTRLGNFRDILVAIAKDTAILVWLDGRRTEHEGEAAGEIFGAEIMELFTMGVGHYTEA